MYTFRSINDEKIMIGTSKYSDFNVFEEHNDIKVQGILKTLFGEAFYQTPNFENAYAYIIEAIDEHNEKYFFTVYHGSTGCAIGCKHSSSSQIHNVILELKELVKSTKPTEYLSTYYYLDSAVKIECGIEDGKIIWNEIYLEEEELEEVYKLFYK